MEQYLKIGIITSTHGLKGEVKVFPVTDDKRRFSLLNQVLISSKGTMRPLPLAGVRYFKDRVILKFRELDSIEAVEELVKSELFVERKDALPLGENEYYIADLIGMEVITKDGEALGSIKDVMQTGANDVYCVESKKYGEILIPAIKQCIINVDVQENIMTVDLLPGLLPEK
jgi:16S rRNA processing protein RimM